MAYNCLRCKEGMTKLPALTLLTLMEVGMLFVLPLGNAAVTQITPTAPTKDFIAACQVGYNITEEELREFPKEPTPEEVEEKFKCYANCLLQGMGFMDVNGRLDADTMKSTGILSEGSYESVMECKAANDMEEDMCEYSFGLMLCLRMIHEELGDESEVVEAIEEEPIGEERKK